MFYNIGDVLVLVDITNNSCSIRRYTNSMEYIEDIFVGPGSSVDIKIGNGGHVYALLRRGFPDFDWLLYQIDKDTKASTVFYDFGHDFLGLMNWGDNGSGEKLYVYNNNSTFQFPEEYIAEISPTGELLAIHGLLEFTQNGGLTLIPGTNRLLYTVERDPDPPFDEYIAEYDLEIDSIVGEYWTPAQNLPPGYEPADLIFAFDFMEIHLLPTPGDLIVGCEQLQDLDDSDLDTTVAIGRLNGVPVYYKTGVEGELFGSNYYDGGYDSALDADGIHVWVMSIQTARLHKFNILTQELVASYSLDGDPSFNAFTIARGAFQGLQRLNPDASVEWFKSSGF